MPSMTWEDYKNMSRQQKTYANILGENRVAGDMMGDTHRAEESISPLYDFLFEILTDALSGNDPAVGEAYQQGMAGIDSNTDSTNNEIRNQLAASGLGESGVGTNLFIQSQAQEDSAKEKLQSSLVGQQLDWKQEAVVQLLGLEKLYQQSISNDRTASMNSLKWLLDMEKLQYSQKNNSNNKLFDKLGESLFDLIIGSIS